jgi:methionyl-tRNA formyltransferase
MPKLGTFNLHASLLPQYRGAAPINWAIINGEKETGLTTFFLKHEIDTGDVILQEKEIINETDNVGDLYERLMKKGAFLTLKTVKLIETGNYQLTNQAKMGEVKHAPKIFKETCQINFNKSAQEVYDFIRGLSPYPAAWTLLNGKILKIYKAKTHEILHEKIIGSFDTDGKTFLQFATANGWIILEEIQLEGKKRMNIVDFLRGYRFE